MMHERSARTTPTRARRWTITGLTGALLAMSGAAQQGVHVQKPAGGAAPDVEAIPVPGRDDFRAAAAKMRFFGLREFLWNRTAAPNMPRAERGEYDTGLAGVLHPWMRDELLVELLRDPEPMVRVAAMAALFDRERPELLPHIASRVGDPAEVALTASPLSYYPNMHRTYPFAEGTVGSVATAMLGFWGLDDAGTRRGFDRWWKARKDRGYSFARLRVGHRRATRGSSPPQLAHEKLSRLATNTLRLPPIARQIAVVALFGEHAEHLEARGWPDFGDRPLRACRALGADRVMQLLRGEPVIDDPDWVAACAKPGHDALPVRFQRFALAHAARLLGPEHSAELRRIGLDRERLEYSLAAARLRPDAATEVLREAVGRWKHPHQALERERCLALLLELAPRDNFVWLLDRFFADHSAAPRAIAMENAVFAAAMRRFSAIDREWLRALVHDRRFAAIDGWTLINLVRELGSYALEPLVDETALLDAGRAIGDKPVLDLERTRDALAERDRAALAAMRSWRDLVRGHVAAWPKASADPGRGR